MRLKNISLRTILKRLEKEYRAKDQLSDGLHIIDYEQLKSENTTLKSKAEEREKDLIKFEKTKTIDMKVIISFHFILRIFFLFQYLLDWIFHIVLMLNVSSCLTSFHVNSYYFISCFVLQFLSFIFCFLFFYF